MGARSSDAVAASGGRGRPCRCPGDPGHKAEGDHSRNGEDRAAYEAALYAAPDLPDEIAALCLELAERREASPEIRAREERARREGEEEHQRWRAANPERARQADILCTPIFPLGPLREPWTDGPRARV